MDAYYAQVEMKLHNLDPSKPMGVIQWNSLVALNYAAKDMGVKRSMRHFEALEVCPDITFVHVATMIENPNHQKSVLDKKQNQEAVDKQISKIEETKCGTNQNQSTECSDDQIVDLMDLLLNDEPEQTIETLIPSSVLKVQCLNKDSSIPAVRRFRIEQRDKESQKVSLAKYREESKKIFGIVQRYSQLVEKASCDEAYVDVTNQVNLKYQQEHDNIFPKNYTTEAWCNSYFMSYPKGEGLFIPETEYEKKLFIANQIAYSIRQDIKRELQYNASCGISHNKTMAKLASANNKPNAQTVVPIRYMKRAMKDVKIDSVRFCGGKVGESLHNAGLTTMGQIQETSIEDLQLIVSQSTAQWIKDLSDGICYEEVKERNLPTTANAVKTFKKVYNFSDLEKLIGLVVLDLSIKVQEALDNLNIFPVSFQIGFKDNLDGNHKTRRFKMISLDQFNNDKRCLTNHATALFKQFEKNILPATSISVGVMNFKNLSELKGDQTTALNKFFKPINNEEYKEKQKIQNEKMRQEIKQNKISQTAEPITKVSEKIDSSNQFSKSSLASDVTKKRSNATKTEKSQDIKMKDQAKKQKKYQVKSNLLTQFFKVSEKSDSK
eukprot:403337853